MKEKKLLIMGVDGTAWHYINYGLEKRKLPNIKKLMEKGIYGKLRSMIPPTTFPVWMCFATGKNPAKIGHYGYVKKLRNSYETNVDVLGCFLKLDSFWKILNRNNIPVGIVNIPYNFPPEETDKFMVSIAESYHTPEGENTCYPPELEKEITEKLGKREYEGSYAYFNKPIDEQLKESMNFIKNRSELNEFLLKKYGKDIQVFMTVFFADRLHHFILDYDKLMVYYEELDRELGRLIKNYNPDNIIFMSDHGGGKAVKEFYINEWLIKEGYLKVKGKKRILNQVGINLENLQKTAAFLGIDNWLVKKLGRDFLENKIRKNIPTKKTPIEDAEIDWSETKACCLHDNGGIFINLKGREPEGSVPGDQYGELRKEIMEKLRNLEDNGKKLEIEVHKREDIYKGLYLEDAPDIVYCIENFDYVPKTGLSGEVFVEPRDPGNHKLHGLFIASGTDFKTGKLQENAELIDVVPTILKMHGIEKDPDIDGKALDILKK